MNNQTWDEFYRSLDKQPLFDLDREVAEKIYGCAKTVQDQDGYWRCECQGSLPLDPHPHSDCSHTHMVKPYSLNGHWAMILLFDMAQRGWVLSFAEDTKNLVNDLPPRGYRYNVGLMYDGCQISGQGMTLSEAICRAALNVRAWCKQTTARGVPGWEWEDPPSDANDRYSATLAQAAEGVLGVLDIIGCGKEEDPPSQEGGG